MQIITISGVDGSGKSTQAKRLIAHYTSRDKRVYYLHAVNFSIAQKLLKPRTRAAAVQGTAADTGQSQTRASWCGVFLRKAALIIDIVRFYFLRKRLVRKNYDYIISDRFFFDTVINIRYLEQRPSGGILERIIPHVDVALFFVITPESIMQRNRVPEQGVAYLRTKTALFTQRAQYWHMRNINADQDPDTVFAAIHDIIL